jgi:hypothetical protein
MYQQEAMVRHHVVGREVAGGDGLHALFALGRQHLGTRRSHGEADRGVIFAKRANGKRVSHLAVFENLNPVAKASTDHIVKGWMSRRRYWFGGWSWQGAIDKAGMAQQAALVAGAKARQSTVGRAWQLRTA